MAVCKTPMKAAMACITNYFPPSPIFPPSPPQQEQDDTEETVSVLPEKTKKSARSLYFKHESIEVKEEIKECDQTVTPDTTPTKDPTKIIGLQESNTVNGSDDVKPNIGDLKAHLISKVDKDTVCDSPEPKLIRNDTNGTRNPKSGKGRRKGATRQRKTPLQTEETTSGDSKQTGAQASGPIKAVEQKPKTAKTKAQKKTEQSNKVTDYFPVRRSCRKPTVEIKKEREQELQFLILSKCVDGLKVVDIPGKGRGVIASKPFAKGDFVIEYEGELIDLSAAKDREEKYSASPDIGCYMYYFVFQDKRYCIDATAESGRLGRLLNHSRFGNCMTKVVGIDDQPYLILVAAKDISPGEELLYDYGDRSKEALEAHPWLAL